MNKTEKQLKDELYTAAVAWSNAHKMWWDNDDVKNPQTGNVLYEVQLNLSVKLRSNAQALGAFYREKLS